MIRLAGRLDDGQIAGTAVAWLSHGSLTLHFVGTQPEYRRRGIGAAMIRTVGTFELMPF
ncbi:GNAT family N-acetyltransferase [Microbispora bryophytorum]|uniref:GNAT family N-acetyltransferase n=1 Tax=Microbispora bryophytorum TaxID=1460882 RepID=UPI0037142437